MSRIEDKDYQRELRRKIKQLKQEKQAVILAHNYERPEVQEIADFLGDSLELSRAVTEIDAKIVVFCGVHFMAETASILNPEKTILLPVKEAGCPMADMINVKKLRDLKSRYPGAPVVCYVNSSAQVKAESDICCTSSNAVEVVRSLSEKEIIFVPDRNLADYIQTQLPHKKIFAGEGYCPTHMRISDEEIIQAKKEHPEALLMAHPECPPRLLALTDYIGSTSGMLEFVRKSPAHEFIVGTEKGMIFRLRRENPNKKFFSPSEHFVCADMKLTTLGWIAHSLENMVHEVKVNDRIRKKARKSLDRMMSVKKVNK